MAYTVFTSKIPGRSGEDRVRSPSSGSRHPHKVSSLPDGPRLPQGKRPSLVRLKADYAELVRLKTDPFYCRRKRVPLTFWLLSVLMKLGITRSISSKYEDSAGVCWFGL